jgi:hypothetical protein
MSKVTVKHGRLSSFSSIAMILLGIMTYFFVNSIGGIVLTVLGIAMYLFERRQIGRSYNDSNRRSSGPPATTKKKGNAS